MIVELNLVFSLLNRFGFTGSKQPIVKLNSSDAIVLQYVEFDVSEFWMIERNRLTVLPIAARFVGILRIDEMHVYPALLPMTLDAHRQRLHEPG